MSRTFKTEDDVRLLRYSRESGTQEWSDATIPQLKVVVGPQSRVYKFRVYRGRQFDKKIGATVAMTLTEARAAALNLLAQAERGELKRESDGPAIDRLTLADGWQIIVERAEQGKIRAATHGYYASLWKCHASVFATERMVAFSEDYERARLWYARLTAAHSKQTEDKAAGIIRNIYFWTTKRFPPIPPSPTRTIEFHGQDEVKYDLSLVALAEHFAAVERERNPVKVALVDFLYFSGMRISSAANLTWAMKEDGYFSVPAALMKNKQPYVLPITDPVEAILDRVRRR